MLLVHGNPRQFEGLIRIAELLESPFIRVSERRGAGDIWFMERMYQVLASTDGAYLARDVGDRQMLHIVSRCRYLRLLEHNLARRLVLAGFAVFDRIFREYGTTAVLTRPVDYYLNDILVRVATARRVPVFALAQATARGMSIVQTLAEHNHVREPREDEIARVLREWTAPRHFVRSVANVPGSFYRHCHSLIEFRLRDLRRFILKHLDRDPLNFHANLAAFERRPRRFRDFPFGIKFATEVERRGKPVIFWPLGWTPECSNDYYCPGLEIIDYERFVLSVCTALAGKFTLAVKDHVNIVGARERSFYDQLRQIPAVQLIDPRIPATEFFRQSDAVMVGTGTAGMEALLARKPVVRYGFTFWPSPSNSLFVHPRQLLLGELDPDELSAFARRCETTWDEIGRDVVRRMLSATIPGNFMYPGLSAAERDAEVQQGMPFIRELFARPERLAKVVFPEDFCDPPAASDAARTSRPSAVDQSEAVA